MSTYYHLLHSWNNIPEQTKRHTFLSSSKSSELMTLRTNWYLRHTSGNLYWHLTIIECNKHLPRKKTMTDFDPFLDKK